MINNPAVLTEDGDIRLHNREGCRIPIFFTDDTGVDRVMTGTTVALVLKSGLRKVLTAGVAVNELVLSIAPRELEAYLGGYVDFVVQDESVTEKPVVWSGKIIITGF